jgi:hypothetical protein
MDDPRWHHVVAAEGAAEPDPRSATASVAVGRGTGQRWYHFGGLGKYRYGDLWAFDPAALSWELVHSGGAGAPEPRCKASLVWVTLDGQDFLILFGGWRGGQLDKLNDTWSFDLAARTWTPVKQHGTVPPPRSAHAMCVIEQSAQTATVMLFGGIGANKFGDAYLVSLSLVNHAVECVWTTLRGANAGLPPRSSYGNLLLIKRTAQQAKDRVLAFGGLTCGQLNDVIAADVPTRGGPALKFERMLPTDTSTGAIPFKRGRHSSCVVASVGAPDEQSAAAAAQVLGPTQLLLVFGGSNLRTQDNGLYPFDVDAGQWRQPIRAAAPPPPMEAHAAAVLWRPRLGAVTAAAEPHLFVFGGWRGTKGWTRGVYILPLLPALTAAQGGSAQIVNRMPDDSAVDLGEREKTMSDDEVDASTDSP